LVDGELGDPDHHGVAFGLVPFVGVAVAAVVGSGHGRVVLRRMWRRQPAAAGGGGGNAMGHDTPDQSPQNHAQRAANGDALREGDYSAPMLLALAARSLRSMLVGKDA